MASLFAMDTLGITGSARSSAPSGRALRPELAAESILALVPTQNWPPHVTLEELRYLQNPRTYNQCASLGVSRLYEVQSVFHLERDILIYFRSWNFQKLH